MSCKLARARAAVWLAAVSLAACALLPDETPRRLRLPEPPPAWQLRFRSLGCELAWIGSGDAVHRRRLQSWPDSVTLDLPRTAPTPVIAVPLHAGVAMLPAGGLGPPAEAELALSWERGPLALCLLRLAAAGCDLRMLNTHRLAEEAASLALDDPWHLDTERLLARIQAGRLRATDVRQAELREVRLPLEAGAWLSASARAQPVVSDGRARLRVPQGFHQLFHAELPLRAAFFVGEGEPTLRVDAHPF